jgi:hypothetical protein
MTGWLTMGTIGFGRSEVMGRSLVPSPPAMMTAFMVSLSRSSAESPEAAKPKFLRRNVS